MKNKIQDFFNSKTVAIIGASRNKDSFSRMMLTELVGKGYTVFPVNPNEDEIAGLKTYRSISQLPDSVEAAYIINRKEIAVNLAREAATKGIKKIWIHVKCDSPEIDFLSQEYGVKAIAGECFFMWSEPVKGVHRFHRFVRSIFDSSIR
jgi:predicted CoA-binding protein